jgi:hypothetical protein
VTDPSNADAGDRFIARVADAARGMVDEVKQEAANAAPLIDENKYSARDLLKSAARLVVLLVSSSVCR